MNGETMTDNKPYLIRALHAWICDNECTPYLYINTQTDGLYLPAHLLAENPLILNLSPNACKDLCLENDGISFQARFSGQVFDVYLPIDAVIAIVARENGQGMTFELPVPTGEKPDEEQQKSDNGEKTNVSAAKNPKKSGKKRLKVVR